MADSQGAAGIVLPDQPGGTDHHVGNQIVELRKVEALQANGLKLCDVDILFFHTGLFLLSDGTLTSIYPRRGALPSFFV